MLVDFFSINISNGEAFIKSIKKTIALSKIPMFPEEPDHLYEELNHEGQASILSFMLWQFFNITKQMKKFRLLYK